MAKRKAKKKDRDIEKGYTTKQMAAKLRRLADCLEQKKPFKMKIALSFPPNRQLRKG
jgi:hypothetical protein